MFAICNYTCPRQWQVEIRLAQDCHPSWQKLEPRKKVTLCFANMDYSRRLFGVGKNSVLVYSLASASDLPEADSMVMSQSWLKRCPTSLRRCMVFSAKYERCKHTVHPMRRERMFGRALGETYSGKHEEKKPSVHIKNQKIVQITCSSLQFSTDWYSQPLTFPDLRSPC